MMRAPASLLSALSVDGWQLALLRQGYEGHASPTHCSGEAWCSGQESNLHALRHGLLRPACLPFHHPSEILDDQNVSGFVAPDARANAHSVRLQVKT